MDTTPDAIFSTDRDGLILLGNHATETLFGYNAEEFTKISFSKILVDFDDPPSELNRIATSLNLVGERRVGRRRNGDVFPLEIIVGKMEAGNRRGYVASIRDVTQRVQIEMRLEQSRKLESIGQLAAGVAHEINTPMQYICDNVSFLQESVDDLFSLVERYSAVIESQCESASCDKVFEGIRKAREDLDIDYLAEEAPRAAKQTIAGVKQVQKIVSSMKKISHPGNDRIELADINEIIEEAITISTNEWRYVADIEVDLDKSITSIPCFSGELSQVFLNLIVNAAHAIDEAKLGLEKGTIKVSSNPLQSGVEVRIEDDGTGIPEEIRDKVFDPFFTTKEVGKGTGQGLSIVYGIVENHNGSIRIESELGLGTTFVVNLPISQEVEIESA